MKIEGVASPQRMCSVWLGVHFVLSPADVDLEHHRPQEVLPNWQLIVAVILGLS